MVSPFPFQLSRLSRLPSQTTKPVHLSHVVEFTLKATIVGLGSYLPLLSLSRSIPMEIPFFSRFQWSLIPLFLCSQIPVAWLDSRAKQGSMPTATMSRKSPSPILLITIIIITVAVAVTASPISVQPKPNFLILPSDDHRSTSLCPRSINPDSCPIRCFRPDPVCGINNVTYWCGCPDAACAGVPVAKLGICDFENKGSGPVSGQALLLVHILWLILLGFFVLFGLL